MGKVLNQQFLPERFFEEICAVPHGSFHEKPLSDWLVRFAQERNLRYRQYPNWDVIIYKPASAGYEDHPPVMLQAHIDMVCEKEADVEHDFEKDPLSLYVEDGWLHARGTTLGADDGVGVAYILSFLEDDTLPHPPLECVFTVQEEVGLIGARDLDYSALTAKRMIGLDDMGGDTCYVSACGSQYMFFQKDFAFESGAKPGFKLTVNGLKGGHSGVCINRELGNAVKIVARSLYALGKDGGVRICDITGGGKDNVIATECAARFTCDLSFEQLKEQIAQLEQTFKTELEFSDPGVTLTLEPTECPELMSEADSIQLIRFLFLLPHGFRHKSMKIPTLTTVSENLANIRFENGTVYIHIFARSELTSYLDMMAEEIVLLTGLFNWQLQLRDKAPGWKYDDHSKVRQQLMDSFAEVTGGTLKPLAEHGGLETGYISGGIPGIDIATCGPLVEDYHTPKERLNLKSFGEIYEVLKHALKAM